MGLGGAFFTGGAGALAAFFTGGAGALAAFFTGGAGALAAFFTGTGAFFLTGALAGAGFLAALAGAPFLAGAVFWGTAFLGTAFLAAPLLAGAAFFGVALLAFLAAGLEGRLGIGGLPGSEEWRTVPCARRRLNECEARSIPRLWPSCSGARRRRPRRRRSAWPPPRPRPRSPAPAWTGWTGRSPASPRPCPRRAGR